MTDSLDLLRRRRFLPLFVSQFLGAFNDNLFKNAMAVLIIYRIGEAAGASAPVLTSIGTGLFMLPYLLFSATAGEIADRFEKSRVMKAVKAAEIPIVALGGVGLLTADVTVMLTALFLLGLQSTVFAPTKYAVLPEYLADAELVNGNALIEAGTFLAILLGSIAGGLLVLAESGTAVTTALMLVVAVSGFLASLGLPAARAHDPNVTIHANPVTATIATLGAIYRVRDVYLSVLGISWFWAMGATFVTQFPAYTKDVLGGNESIVTLLLAMFSVGVGAGSVLCARLLKGEISARYLPFGAIGMTVFSVDLFFAGSALPANGGELAGIPGFIAEPRSWRVLADFLLIAVCGGLYTVPLYAILQKRSPENERARAVAANNIVNAVFIVAASGIAAALLALGLDVIHLFLILAALNGVVALYVCRLLPDELLRGMLTSILRVAYRIEVNGLENLKRAGERMVVVANHVSLLDALLIAVFIPGRPVFAIDTFMARRWWIRPFLGLVEAFPLDPTNPMAVRALTHKVREGHTCVIFPEGKLTRTGSLMKVYDGPGVIAAHADAAIVPVRIDGAQYTPFSRLKGKMRLRWFPKIRLSILPASRVTLPEGVSGRERRRRIGTALYDIMSLMVFETSDRDRTLFQALLDARAIHGGSAIAIEDLDRKPLSYDRLIAGSLVLGRALSRISEPGERIGVLLPNAAATVTTLMALQAYGRVPAMLNFTTGVDNVRAAAVAATLRTVISSRRFVEQARLTALVEALSGSLRFVWLEDLRASLSITDRLFGMVARPWAALLHRRRRVAPDSPAVILFTSGSEGTPKGVALSHANILANCLQLAACIDFNESDTVLNVLPLFHSFGLTGGLIMPLVSGVRTFLYPSPLHYRIVPEIAYDTNATIFFATNTFLAGYARHANPYDFYSVRYVFAGAEKVEARTRQVFAEKFGLRILEGYGVTETAPVLACNTPMHFKAGTVGRFLPGIEYRLEPVPGIDEGGRLLVHGPNVMVGYLRAEVPGVIVPPPVGWHDTGDIVAVDDEGYVRIVGRAKRFAKIGGEMVSLTRIESEIAALWPEHQHAVVADADESKGERAVLVTTAPSASREAIHAAFRERGLAELLVPRTIVKLDRLPVLGSGKTDYVAVEKLVRATA